MSRHVYRAPAGRPPWERQDREGPKAWEAFVVYRDLGSERSLRLVSERLGKNSSYIESLSVQHNWVNRAAAWDAELDAKARRAQIAEVKQMRKRHAGFAVSMQGKAMDALKSLPKDELKAADISRMMEVATKIERIARGDVGEVIEEREGEPMQTVTFYMPDNHRNDAE